MSDVKAISEKLIQKARASLILNQPFFASLLLPMSISPDEGTETASTDGDSIKYNPEWIAGLSKEETLFLLSHEVMHCVTDTMGRRGDRDPLKWNYASDYVINQLLTDQGVGRMPKGGLLDKKLFMDGGETDIGVYNILPDDFQNPKGGGKNLDMVFDSGSNHGNKPVDQATIKQKQNEMRTRVIQAASTAKAMGKMSAGLERFVKEVTEVKTDWRVILRNFFTERMKSYPSFARPKRRFLGEDLCLPSLVGEGMGTVVVAVDCSGSINDKVLQIFGSEISKVKEDVNPKEIIVMYFDTRVLRVDTFSQDEEIVLRPVGGGGTAFAPVFEEMKKYQDIKACVFLTDLECNDFGEEPDCPVLWTVWNPYIKKNQIEETIPFGSYVIIND